MEACRAVYMQESALQVKGLETVSVSLDDRWWSQRAKTIKPTDDPSSAKSCGFIRTSTWSEVDVLRENHCRWSTEDNGAGWTQWNKRCHDGEMIDVLSQISRGGTAVSAVLQLRTRSSPTNSNFVWGREGGRRVSTPKNDYILDKLIQKQFGVQECPPTKATVYYH